jgi:hypothetical protein
MDYKRLIELDNIYPNISSYKEGATNKTQILYGSYPEKNKIEFKVPPTLDTINYLPDTNFRFVLAIFKDYKDTNPIYYTSEIYYRDLQLALLENNPYFLQSSFSSENIVPYVIDSTLKVFNTFVEPEYKSFINVRQNIMFRSGSVIDYDNLVRYIDWVVDTPSPLDEANFGVLQPDTIAGWDLLNGNFVTGKVTSGISASFGIGKEFVQTDSLSSGSNISLLESNLKFQEEKLKKITEEISAINIELGAKSNYKLDNGQKGKVTVYNNLYETKGPISFFFSKNQASQYLTTQLKNKVVELTTQKDNVQIEYNLAKSNLNNANASAKSVLGDVQQLANNATTLLGKIPKIPKLPDIPQIPKIPSLNDLGNAVLSSTAALIPSIPKINLPKIPSLKLPPLKLFKKKEPKEPKKVKNNKKKGLQRLEDQANQAQNLVAGATSNLQSQSMGTVGNLNKGLIQSTTQLAGGGTLTTTSITSGVLAKGETEASVLADIQKSMIDVASHVATKK